VIVLAHWQSKISSFWFRRVENSKIGTILAAGVILTLSLVIGWVAFSLYAEGVDPGLRGKLFLGISILIGGIILWGFEPMGLQLNQTVFERIWILSLFLLAIPVLVLPVTSIEISKLNIPQVLVTGFWEETLYRGFIFALWAKLFGLRSPLSIVLLLVMSSLVFGVSHPNQGLELFIRSSLGFLLGVITVYTTTILFPALLHAFYDGLASIITYTPSPSLQIIVLFSLCVIGGIFILKITQPYIPTREP
jgi:membrane protease YdiL (CAAX protease family)